MSASAAPNTSLLGGSSSLKDRAWGQAFFPLMFTSDSRSFTVWTKCLTKSLKKDPDCFYHQVAFSLGVFLGLRNFGWGRRIEFHQKNSRGQSQGGRKTVYLLGLSQHTGSPWRYCERFVPTPFSRSRPWCQEAVPVWRYILFWSCYPAISLQCGESETMGSSEL